MSSRLPEVTEKSTPNPISQSLLRPRAENPSPHIPKSFTTFHHECCHRHARVEFDRCADDATPVRFGLRLPPGALPLPLRVLWLVFHFQRCGKSSDNRTFSSYTTPISTTHYFRKY